MAWTTPKTWASGYVVLAADLNTHLRDNLNVTAPAVMTTAGDIIYASGANTPARLGKSTTSTQYLANTGSSNIPQWNEVALATGVSGTLPVGNGGTGQTSLTTGAILIGNASGAVTMVTQTTKGQILVGDGSGAPQMLAVGGTNDHVLTVDSGEDTGMKWAAGGGGAELSTVVRDFIDNGNSEILYFMGGADWRNMTDSGNKLIANAMAIGLTGYSSDSTAAVLASTTINGGWQLITNNATSSHAAVISKNSLDPTDDWTIIWRGVVPSAATQTFGVGLLNKITPSTSSNHQIGIRVSGTGNFFGFTDSGGTETTLDMGVAPSATTRSLKIAITGGGGSVEFFIDNVSQGSITANIPTGSTFLLQTLITTETTVVREIHVADFAAYRDG